jgi:dTMP kinase
MQNTKERGKIIVIEGSDGSGKKTQTKLLVEKALKTGYNLKTMSFPQYDKPTGQKIKEYLSGKFGGVEDSSNIKVVIKLYADDRLDAKPKILKWLNPGKWIKPGKDLVFDRWIESNIGHQAAKVKAEDRIKLTEWIKLLEVDQNGLPEADLVIYLDLPVEFNQKAMEKEGRTKDIHESNVPYLLRVEDTYRWLASKNENWRAIDCLKKQADSKQDRIRKTVEEIHKEIWNIVKPVLKTPPKLVRVVNIIKYKIICKLYFLASKLYSYFQTLKEGQL